LPLIAWIVEIFDHGYPVAAASIARIHNESSVLYVVDLVPFLIGVTVYYTSRLLIARHGVSGKVSKNLEDRQRLLELTLDTIDQGIIVRDSDDNIILFNDTLSELTGVDTDLYAANASAEEIQNSQDASGVTGNIDPEIQKLIDDWIQRRKVKGFTGKLSYLRQSPDGKWLRVSLQSIASGFEIRTFQDVTDQKIAENDAIARHEILQLTLENMGQGLTVFDNDWNLRAFNSRYQEHFDLPDGVLNDDATFDDVVGTTMRLDYGEEELEKRMQVVRDQKRMTEVWRREFMRPTGRYLDIMSNPIPGGGFVVTSTDVTEKKKIEAVVAEKEALLKTVLENMSDGVFAVDSELKYVMFNDRYTELIEVDVELVDIDVPIRKIILRAAKRGGYGPGDPEELTEARLAQLSNRDYVETEINTPGGRIIHIRKVSLDEGGAVVTLTDISRRKEAEIEIRQAKDEAEAANRVKSQFLANMSHEIRTPLSGISGFLELLELSPLEDQQRQYVKRASIAAGSLVEIIGDVLDFSKIEAGYFDTYLSDVSVMHTVLEIVSLLSPRATEQGNRLSVQVAPGVSRLIRTDALRLKQVLMNITGNSIKFTQDGIIHITVEPDSDDASDAGVRFCVTDTGVGFDAEKSKAVFEEFAQAEASTTRRFGGTGLGLAISKRLVELMGGRIGNYGEEGNGAEFWFTLPANGAVNTPARQRRNIDARIAAWQDRPANSNGKSLKDEMGLDGLKITEIAELDDVFACSRNDIEVLLISTGSIDHACTIGRSFTEETPAIRFLICDDAGFRNRQLAFRTGYTHLVSHEDALKGLDDYILSASLGSMESDLSGRVIDANVDDLIAEIDPALRELPVLLIDDLEMNRIIASRQIERLGLKYETAENGERGLYKATFTDYGMIIVDCSMPVMDGFEFTERFRLMERDIGRERHTPVVAMTANATVGDAERCIAAGMDDYMAKPVTLERVAEMAARWLAPGVIEGLGPSPWSVPPTSIPTTSKLKETESLGDVSKSELPIDMKVLASAIASEDPAAHLRMLLMFQEAYLKIQIDIDNAMTVGDHTVLREAAHAGAGAAANIGAVPLSLTLKELELSAANEDDKVIPEIHNRVREKAKNVLVAIDALGSEV